MNIPTIHLGEELRGPLRGLHGVLPLLLLLLLPPSPRLLLLLLLLQRLLLLLLQRLLLLELRVRVLRLLL